MNPQDREAYKNLIIDLIMATSYSGGDSEVVYPLLQANLDKLDDNFIAILRECAPTKAEPTDSENIARVIGKLSLLISNFPLGSKRTNLEISIAGYDLCLTVFTRDGNPEIWGIIQNNLGFAYHNRIVSDRAENLELAIASYKKALQVRTKEAFPTQWAMTQNNLAIAYCKRIAADRAENIELAIAFLIVTPTGHGITGSEFERINITMSAQYPLDSTGACST